MLHSKESVLNWLERSVIGYLYGEISSSIIITRIQKAQADYGIGREEVLRLVESVEGKYETYFGGRYRLAFAVIGKRPTVASFGDQKERVKLIASLREAVKRA